MIKVLYFDHDKELKEKYFPRLNRALNEHSDIELDAMDIPVSFNFGVGVEQLEARLPMYNVLVCHPGVNGQDYIFNKIPIKFPNLRTIILTDAPSDYIYESKGNVTILSFNNIGSIINYILNLESC